MPMQSGEVVDGFRSRISDRRSIPYKNVCRTGFAKHEGIVAKHPLDESA
jgi:hypothetical protein